VFSADSEGQQSDAASHSVTWHLPRFGLQPARLSKSNAALYKEEN